MRRVPPTLISYGNKTKYKQHKMYDISKFSLNQTKLQLVHKSFKVQNRKYTCKYKLIMKHMNMEKYLQYSVITCKT